MTEDDFGNERLSIPKRAKVRILTLADAIKRKLMERSKLSSLDNPNVEESTINDNLDEIVSVNKRSLKPSTQTKIDHILS